jgi:DNA-binding CsgD family transcriptional regulator
VTTTRVTTGTELLERESALADLGRAVDAAKGRTGSLVLVEGEAGVGKTALLRRFVGLQGGELRTLWGSCDPLFTPRPLGPFLDVADAIGGDLLATVQSDPKPYDVASSLMRELAAGPTILALDDMHWADEASLDVLGLVARRVHGLPAVVVATYRGHEVGPTHALRLVIGELASSQTVRRVRLEPLSEESVASLAAPYGIDPAELYRKTAGNPLFVTEVLAAGESVIPETVRDAVLARAARLCSSAQRLLEIVSVVPQQAELWLLADIEGSDQSGLDECLGSGLLTATPETLAFRHELVRLAIEDSLRPDRRSALHAAVLAAFERAPTVPVDAARLAHHAEGAADAEAVLRYAPAAAKRASALGAHREAAAQWARAARFSDTASLEAQAELYENLAYERYLTGDFGDAVAATREALDRYRAVGNRLKEGACLHALSRLLWSGGETPEALAVGRQAVTLLASLPPGDELARAYAQLAALSLSTNDLTEVADWCTRAEDLAESLDAAEIVAASRVTRYAAEYSDGSPGGRERLTRELELALAGAADEIAGRAFNYIVRIARRERDYAVADRYLDSGFEYCRDRELGNFRQGLGAERARRQLDRGDWAAATDAAELVLTTARTAGMAPFIALTVLGQVRARRGDPEVWIPLDGALAMAEPSGELQRLGPVAAARAEAAWLVGDCSRALAETDSAFELALEKRDPWFAGELAYWRWRCGADEAPEWIAEPYALELNGAWADAVRAWRSLGCPYEAALALGDGDEAAQLRALEELNELGARPAAAIVGRRLRGRGVRVPRGPRATTTASPAGLTERETEVLALVAEGRQNTEIADHLVVSRRTVDHHVSAILRKLDARTRGEAVAKATRLGLVEPH